MFPINQIYSIVNTTAGMVSGLENLTAVDAQGLVAMGDAVLSSTTNTENFLNTLVQRIGKTIVSSRAYTSKFKGFEVGDFEWGAIVQKIKVLMPQAEADQSYDLVDGNAVDHYKVAKPKAVQKLFVTETPYQFHITVQREHLKEAFLSESAMGSFIQAIFTEVQNAIELAVEGLGRTALANMIAEVDSTTRKVDLLAGYNGLKGTSLTAEQALVDGDFLRYAVGEIKKVSKRMTDLTTLYNDGNCGPRHTPKDLQHLIVMTDFESAAETQVQYAAFQESYVKLDNYIELSYLQAALDPMAVKVKKASDGAEVEVKNVVAVLCDKEALGLYKKDMWTATTPFNAAGGYTNTYWHMKELYFNDLSENFVVFTLG